MVVFALLACGGFSTVATSSPAPAAIFDNPFGVLIGNTVRSESSPQFLFVLGVDKDARRAGRGMGKGNGIRPTRADQQSQHRNHPAHHTKLELVAGQTATTCSMMLEASEPLVMS